MFWVRVVWLSRAPFGTSWGPGNMCRTEIYWLNEFGAGDVCKFFTEFPSKTQKNMDNDGWIWLMLEVSYFDPNVDDLHESIMAIPAYPCYPMKLDEVKDHDLRSFVYIYAIRKKTKTPWSSAKNKDIQTCCTLHQPGRFYAVKLGESQATKLLVRKDVEARSATAENAVLRDQLVQSNRWAKNHQKSEMMC